MSYINVNTLEKVEPSDIILANPTISFPNRGWTDEDISAYGYAELHMPIEHPLPGVYEKLVETTPAKIDGKWYVQFSLVPMTEEEIVIKNQTIKQDIISQTQQRLDSFAQTRGYDNILSLCTYATSTIPQFQLEGQYGVEARDATWTKLYEIMDEVEAGTRPMPQDYVNIEQQLPPLVWPNTQ